MHNLRENNTSARKEPVEIECADCGARFRLWVPEDMLPEWEKGVRINCVKCGAATFVKKTADGFETSPVAAAAQPQPTPAASEAPEPAPEPARPVQTEPDKDIVLIVEDDRLSRNMVENSLTESGFRIIAAKNAAEAMKAVRKERVSLIVTDLYLKNPADPASDMDGEELLNRMMQTGVGLPAIITTGKDIIDDLVLDPKWFELKVKGFIQKGNPFWVEELKLKVKEVLYKG